MGWSCAQSRRQGEVLSKGTALDSGLTGGPSLSLNCPLQVLGTTQPVITVASSNLPLVCSLEQLEVRRPRPMWLNVRPSWGWGGQGGGHLGLG